MAIIRDKGTTLKQILSVIPDDLLSKLTVDTKVDYCSKVLFGKHMFYLLLYGILKTDKLSQRTLADIFSDPFFRTLFNIEGDRKLAHSSLSDRLSCIDMNFFRLSYDHIYSLLCQLYTPDEINKAQLQRVDSTLISDASGMLKEGITCKGKKKTQKKMVKYSVVFDGTFASLASLHTESSSANENRTLPQSIFQHYLKKEKGHSDIYLIDRGVSSAEVFSTFCKEKISFVGRLMDNRKLFVVEDLLKKDSTDDIQTHTILEDKIVYLYKKEECMGKSGKMVRKQVLVENPVRVVKISLENDPQKNISFITNNLEASALEIAQSYRRRWDIEVFFRFLKQELNLGHLLSMNANGIQVVMYMTLIVAMLIMIYKRFNNVGYTTAKRRMGLELNCLIAAILVIKSGGDLKKAGLNSP